MIPAVSLYNPISFQTAFPMPAKTAIKDDYALLVKTKLLKASSDFERGKKALPPLSRFVWIHHKEQSLLGLFARVLAWMIASLKAPFQELEKLHHQEIIERQWFDAYKAARYGNLGSVELPFRADREFVRAAIDENPLNLQFAAAKLQDDMALVLQAVNQYGYTLQYASLRLRNDPDIVLAALKQHWLAIRMVGPELKENEAVWLAAVKHEGEALYCASKEVKTNKKITLAAVNQNGLALQYASPTLKADREVVLTAVNQNGLALEYAVDLLRADRAIIAVATTQNPDALKHAIEPSTLLAPNPLSGSKQATIADAASAQPKGPTLDMSGCATITDAAPIH